MRNVDHNLAIALLDRIRDQTAADRGARRRAVDKVEASIVLRAFDLLVFHQAVGQMDIPVRAQSVRGVEFTFVVPVNGIGLLAVIKALDVRKSEIGGSTNTHPPLRIRYGGGLVGAFIEARLWLWKLTLYVIRRIFDLPENGGNDFAPGCEEAWIRRGAVILHGRVQVALAMVGHQWEHVMLYVIVHVPVKEPVDRIHVHRSTVETVIENVLRQPGVLGEAIHNKKPRTEEIRETNQEQRKEAACIDRNPDHREIDSHVYPRIPIYLRKLYLGNEGLFFGGHTAERVQNDSPEVLRIIPEVEERLDDGFHIGRPRDRYFRITTDNDGVAMVPGVTPPPYGGLAHDHE